MALTYREASEAVDGRVVWWCEVSGIPYAFSGGVAAADFSDGYTDTLTFKNLLAPIKNTFTRSIEIVPGKGSSGGFSVSLVDAVSTAYPDGFLTWLFGGDRSTITRSRLTANVTKHAGGAGHDWALDTTGMAADVDYYCELETVRPDNVSAGFLEDVVRSRWKSPATSHKARRHSGTNVWWPEVTDHPTVWRGRIVTLFQSYLDGAGELAGGASGARAAAHKVRGILRDIEYRDGQWVLRVDSLDSILKRKLVKGQPWVTASQALTVTPNDLAINGFDGTETTAYVLDIELTDSANEVEYFYVAIDAGTYSPDSFLDAINTAAAALGGGWVGELRLSATSDSLMCVYSTDTADARRCDVHFGWPNVLDANRERNNVKLWKAFGLEMEGGGFDLAVQITPDIGSVGTSEEYPISIPRTPAGFTLTPRGGDTTVAVMANEEFSAADFAVGEFVTIVSDFPSRARVTAVGSDSLTLSAATSGGNVLRPATHVYSETNPIRIRKAYYGVRPAAESIAGVTLRLLLSTGVSGYNDATYDTEDEGIGAEIPHETPNAGASSTDSIINVAAFERFFGEAAHLDGVVDWIWEPTEAMEYVHKRVSFLGGHLVIEDGQISVRRGISPLRSESVGTVSHQEMQPDSRTVTFGDGTIVDGIRYKTNYDYARAEYMLTLAVLRGDAATDDGQNYIDLEDKGLQFGIDQLAQLGDEWLSDYMANGWQFGFTVDRAFRDLEPGQIVEVTDEGASMDGQGLPTPLGTRGLSDYMTVISASTSETTGKTAIVGVVTRVKRSGFSASAWVSSYVNGGSTAVLTCEANVFRPSADGVDAAAFTVGDKVRLLLVNADRAGVAGLPDSDDAGQAGFTITVVSGNTITIDGLVDADFVSGTSPMVLIHDPYQTASQTAAAKLWCHIGDSTGDIGDGGDAAFEW